MSLTTRRFFSFFRSAAALSALLCAVGTVEAATLAYPDQGPVAPGYTFTNIVESSGTDGLPLYGTPTPFAIGLGFSPTTFSASSTGGGADLTDGQLNFMAKAGPNAPGISAISVSESGNYTLTGVGTAATEALAGTIIRVSVVELNGLPVPPIQLVTSNASVGFNLVANPGAGQLWSLGTTVNVAGQLVTLGFAPSQHATKVNVAINNTLVAVSEPGTRLLSNASIEKTKFDVTIQIPIPEPASFTMIAVSLWSLGLARERRRGR